jgi:hypothetical protein
MRVRLTVIDVNIESETKISDAKYFTLYFNGPPHQISIDRQATLREVSVVFLSPSHKMAKEYSRVTSTKSPSFYVTTCNVSLTNFTVLPTQSHYCNYYGSRRTSEPPPLWLQKYTDIRAQPRPPPPHPPEMWHQPRLANVTCALSGRICGINPAMYTIWTQSFPITSL